VSIKLEISGALFPPVGITNIWGTEAGCVEHQMTVEWTLAGIAAWMWSNWLASSWCFAVFRSFI